MFVWCPSKYLSNFGQTLHSTPAHHLKKNKAKQKHGNNDILCAMSKDDKTSLVFYKNTLQLWYMVTKFLKR